MYLIKDYSVEQQFILRCLSHFMDVVPPSEDQFLMDPEAVKNYGTYQYMVCRLYTFHLLHEALREDVIERMKETGEYESTIDAFEKHFMRHTNYDDDSIYPRVQVLEFFYQYTRLLFEVCSRIGEIPSPFIEENFISELDRFVDRLNAFFELSEDGEYVFAKLGRLYKLYHRVSDGQEDYLETYEQRFRYCVLIAFGELGSLKNKKKMSETQKMSIIKKVSKRHADRDMLRNDTGDPYYGRWSLFELMCRVFFTEGERTGKLSEKVPYGIMYMVQYFMETIAFRDKIINMRQAIDLSKGIVGWNDEDPRLSNLEKRMTKIDSDEERLEEEVVKNAKAIMTPEAFEEIREWGEKLNQVEVSVSPDIKKQFDSVGLSKGDSLKEALSFATKMIAHWK